MKQFFCILALGIGLVAFQTFAVLKYFEVRQQDQNFVLIFAVKPPKNDIEGAHIAPVVRKRLAELAKKVEDDTRNKPLEEGPAQLFLAAQALALKYRLAEVDKKTTRLANESLELIKKSKINEREK